ncbi:hypothetical protein NGR_c17840 [Sinorhizobium fredii NGR234]|uniref:Uncharacterized protein n=1 Tax=Sinorhizobium fredii (strain NBRC 101917 / NGR234) TaxID=394 RepID=C3MDM9_SINFN|nr:hypothetical protein NGR_c17840 [Sinorhizobium fredii NGR234]
MSLLPHCNVTVKNLVQSICRRNTHNEQFKLIIFVQLLLSSDRPWRGALAPCPNIANAHLSAII